MKATCEADIVQMLEGSGLPYEIVSSKRNRQVRVCGRLCGVLPHGVRHNTNPHAFANVAAQVRRAIQAHSLLASSHNAC